MSIWQIIGWILAAIVFSASVLDSIIRWYRAYRDAKKSANKAVDDHIKEVIKEDREFNCPAIITRERDLLDRRAETDSIKEFITSEIRPIKESLTDIKDWNKKMHHSIMDDLQIKLRAIYKRFERKGTLSEVDQTNWDKYYSGYKNLGGNSDIKRMDEIIQKTRLEISIGKAKNKKSSQEDDDESND